MNCLGKRMGVDGVQARGVWGEGAGRCESEERVGSWGWGITSARAGRGRRECIVQDDDERKEKGICGQRASLVSDRRGGHEAIGDKRTLISIKNASRRL